MFYYLQGKLSLPYPGTAVVDCGGVGYRLTVSGNTYSALAALPTDSLVKLYTHLSVREDAHELFGFYREEELDAYRLLITVSGIGPKAGVAILSTLTVEQLVTAVTSDDPRAISAAPGVGGKTAARVILELAEKITTLGITAEAASATPTATKKTDELADARNALTALGYSRSEAVAALSKVDTKGLTLEEIVWEALKTMN
ncbi:MAG: Holliday junction branch migration protein RuvA [Oscillospiraceae bacterium]|nr:Holliday junction branch migration protein RuvA [Oscillospiraceae bacterium]